MEFATCYISEINVVHTCKNLRYFQETDIRTLNVRIFFSSVEKYYSITLFFVCVFAFTPGNFELTIHFYVETTIHSVSTEHRKDITLSISCLKSVVS